MTASQLAGQGHRLGDLPGAAGLSRSTYHYHTGREARVTRPDVEPLVREVFARTPNGCGHRQALMALRHEFGVTIRGGDGMLDSLSGRSRHRGEVFEGAAQACGGVVRAVRA